MYNSIVSRPALDGHIIDDTEEHAIWRSSDVPLGSKDYMKDIITLYGTANSVKDIHVFYIGGIKWMDGATQRLAAGIGFCDQDKYGNNIFIDSYQFGSLQTSPGRGILHAHELGHVLELGHVDEKEKWKIMLLGWSTYDHTGNRRFTTTEEETMRGDQHVRP